MAISSVCKYGCKSHSGLNVFKLILLFLRILFFIIFRLLCSIIENIYNICFNFGELLFFGGWIRVRIWLLTELYRIFWCFYTFIIRQISIIFKETGNNNKNHNFSFDSFPSLFSSTISLFFPFSSFFLQFPWYSCNHFSYTWTLWIANKTFAVI